MKKLLLTAALMGVLVPAFAQEMNDNMPPPPPPMQAEGGNQGGPSSGRGNRRERPSREQMQKMREEMIKNFDKDGDGELNEEEQKAMRADFEKRMSAEEMDSSRFRGARGGRGFRPDSGRMPDRPTEGDRSSFENRRKAMMDKMNGEKNTEEVKKQVEDRRSKMREEMIKKFDTDGDGKLNEEEEKAMRADFEKRMKERPSRQQEPRQPRAPRS